ncbi:MAG: hypothetical protein IJ113_06055 [Eggerthellaceae bacterium]|nr:hypothetical protein [Eggerthellaceae bacterium]
MRNFGNDAPQFMSFTLGKDKTVYKLPLAASLPLSESIKFSDLAAMPDGEEKNAAAVKFQYDLVVKYLGEEVADLITVSQLGEIFGAWVEESQNQGATPGE